jgi:hypothetical protein
MPAAAKVTRTLEWTHGDTRHVLSRTDLTADAARGRGRRHHTRALGVSLARVGRCSGGNWRRRGRAAAGDQGCLTLPGKHADELDLLVTWLYRPQRATHPGAQPPSHGTAGGCRSSRRCRGARAALWRGVRCALAPDARRACTVRGWFLHAQRTARAQDNIESLCALGREYDIAQMLVIADDWLMTAAAWLQAAECCSSHGFPHARPVKRAALRACWRCPTNTACRVLRRRARSAPRSRHRPAMQCG